MRLDQTTIPLVPRTVSGCLDLAVRFVGERFREVVGIWSSIALPTCVLVYLAARELDLDVRATLGLVFLATVPLGALLVDGAAHSLFGRSLRPRLGPRTDSTFTAIRLALNAAAGLLLAVILAEVIEDAYAVYISPGGGLATFAWYGLAVVLLLRAGVVLTEATVRNPSLPDLMAYGLFVRRLPFAVAPALVLYWPSGGWGAIGLLAAAASLLFVVRGVFRPEAACLRRIDASLHTSRADRLVRTERGELFQRAFLIGVFCWMLTVVVFAAVDYTAAEILQVPILFGRLRYVFPPLEELDDGLFEYVEEGFAFAVSDPTVLALLAASLLTAYTIGRLAWFFCYLDIRVRRDLWDIELQFIQQARTLEATAGPNH